METERLQVNLGNNPKAELLIREVNEANELPVQEPEPIGIYGTIGAPVEFLEKRWNSEDGQINHDKTHILVDRDKAEIHLVTNEDCKRKRQEVTGTIQFSRQYKAFHINDDNTVWTPEILGQFCRINRVYFEDKQQNMQLVSLLKNFKAKINTDVERQIKDNGSFTDNYSQIVDSNLPSAFHVRIPIYKGAQVEDIEIEIMASINGREVGLQLISAGAISTIEEVRDRLIDAELDKIREIAPEIPIIEI